MSHPADSLSKEEAAAVGALLRLERRWPKSLWLFAASGSLHVMKKNASGEREMNAGTQGYESARIVADIKIESDGGDW